MATPNVNPAAFSVPATAQPVLSAYGRAIVNLAGSIVDCWPCDDKTGATKLRNLISGRSALDTFSAIVIPGLASMLANDPNGRSALFSNGAAYHAAAYTMPSSGSLEFIWQGLYAGSDGAYFGNWNGSGITFLNTGVNSFRYYKDASLVNYSLVRADLRAVMHFGLTWDGTTERLYVNGVQRSTQSVGSPAAGGYVGVGVYSSIVHPVSGRYQWLTIYNRALTATEMAQHAALAV